MTKIKVTVPYGAGNEGSIDGSPDAVHMLGGLSGVSDHKAITHFNRAFPRVSMDPTQHDPTLFAYASGQAAVVDIMVNLWNLNNEETIERAHTYM